ncbi:MAG: carboxylating nicotinate-nucleotide diphosphorylase [FCB group bacterium]|nr:carboxylating nicotinate-nucleotide diphosphorylase [FCB group bacterium]
MNSLPDKYKEHILKVIRNALLEDIGSGDITSNCIFSENATCSGKIISKASGIIAGIAVARKTFTALDDRVQFDAAVSDGTKVAPGTIIASVSGPCRAVLSGERTALNFLQRMSGIATFTNEFVERAKKGNPDVIILDTRKTAPGLRVLDKWAVKLGGGQNHRFGLYDMVLIKENHIHTAGSIRSAVERVRKNSANNYLIEVEVKNIEDLQEALEARVDRIMLDNMSPDQIRRAVRIAENRIPLEASGNISLDNVEQIAATGVHFISVGQLTHSAKALDISFLLD